MTPRDVSFDLDGRQVEAAWWGPGPDEVPTLVLLHEGLGCVALWRNVPQRMAEATGCGVLAYSRFGYGGSDTVAVPRPLNYMHREAEEVLGRVLDAQGIRRCILVGHSDGASIALIYAGSTQDHRVRGIALLAPHVMVEEMCVAEIARTKERYETTDLRTKMAKYHRDVNAAFWGWNRAWLDPGFPEALQLQPEIAHVRVPILVVQGEADPYGTMEHLRIIRQEAYSPLDALTLPGIGHSPHLEAPDATLDAVRDFADRLFRLHEPE
ncbi:alpha/beta fold hydrolase [Roseomonas sp. CCTCC AB2023176]|uniref:alpha/beta fold hydrolase n=1 Tax=Roseomonas sp. CCTCC AB2023176 TaxID=3342640 RepID=UPI0035DF5036